MLQNGLESDVARFTTHVQTCQQPDLVQDRFACMHVFLLPVFKYLKGTFHSNQNARFEFSATFTGEWNSIIQNFPKRRQPREAYPNSRNICSAVSKFSKVLVECRKAL